MELPLQNSIVPPSFFQVQSLEIIVVSVILLIGLLYYFGTKSFNFFHDLNIPSVANPTPWLGHSLSYWRDGGYTQDTEHVKKYGRVFGMYEGRTPVLVIADADACREILVSQFTKFVKRRTLATVRMPMPEAIRHTVIGQAGPNWNRHRRSFKHVFNSLSIARFSMAMNACAKDMVDKLEVEQFSETQSAVVEMKHVASTYTLDVLLSTIFNLSTNDPALHDEYIKHTKSFFKHMTFDSPGYVLYHVMPWFANLCEYLNITILSKEGYRFYFDQIIEKCKAESVDPSNVESEFLQLFLQSGKEAPENSLSVMELVGNSMLFMLSAAEIPSMVIYWMMYLLAQHPEVQQRLYEEVISEWNVADDQEEPIKQVLSRLPYLDMVMSEVLRRYPPGQRIDVVCNETTTLLNGKVKVPKGTGVCYSIWALHHDELYWTDPFKFDPERFSAENRDKIKVGSYVPFGNGPRFCIGMHYAKTEEKLAMIHILRRFKISPAVDYPAPTMDSPTSQTKALFVNLELRSPDVC